MNDSSTLSEAKHGDDDPKLPSFTTSSNRQPCIFHEYSVQLRDVKLHYHESLFKTLMTRDPPEVDVTDRSDGRHHRQQTREASRAHGASGSGKTSPIR